MLQIHKILVPNDFSESSEQALAYALELAERVGAELHMVFAEVLHGENAPEPDAAGDSAQEAERVRARMDEQVAATTSDAAAADAIEIKRVVVRGVAPAPALLEYADAKGIDLILMGTHGRRGLSRVLLGSVAEEIVRMASCPVLTVRRQEQPSLQNPASILVPIDFSVHSKAALTHAKEIAALYGARLDLLHVIEEQLHPAFYTITVQSMYDLVPDIEEKAFAELRRFDEEADGPDVETEYHVRGGHAAREILAFAQEAQEDLIVMSTHGLRGLEHFVLGSVAEKVVRRAQMPVLTLKAFGTSLVAEPAALRSEATH